MQIFAVVIKVSLLNALFWKTPEGTIAKFGVEKTETLGYFPLAGLALSLAVLELLTAKSPICRFRTFGTQTPGRISEMGDQFSPHLRT